MFDPNFEIFVDDYLTGKLDPSLEEQVRAYLDATPGRRGVMAGVRTATRGDHIGTPRDVRASQRALFDAIDEYGKSQSAHRPRRGSRWIPHGWVFSIAGSLGLALLLVAAWIGGERQLNSTLSNSVSSYSTASGQQATITLADGSTVLLNVGSRLKVPANYATGNRTLHLTGEAFFTVAHHSGTPFTVIAGPSTTRVLGTRFVVRHYEDDTSAIVAVQDGKVAVDSLVLSAQQQVAVTSSGLSAVQLTDFSRFRFALGTLALNNVPLPQALGDLNRWYNVTIRLGDPELAKQRVTGEFTYGSPDNLSEILELMFDVRVERQGRTLTLFPK